MGPRRSPRANQKSITGAIPGINRPIPQNPVVLQDVTDAIEFTEQLKKRRRLNPKSVTEDETSRAMVNQYQVIQNYSYVKTPPPWFAPALAAALAPMQAAIAPMAAAINRIENRLVQSMNGSAIHLSDFLTAPVSPAQPAEFPRTCEDLMTMTLEDCDVMIATYNIIVADNDELAEKRRKIAAFLGVRGIIVITRTVI